MLKYLLSLSLILGTLFAHPHTFIDIYPTIDSKNNNIKTIHFKWSFDEMTSQLLQMEFDQNMDGEIDKKEVSYIKKNYFDILEKFNFYTDIKLSKNSIKTKPINFTSKIDENMKITYEFDVAINTNKENVQIEFYDIEMFTACMLKKDFVTTKLPYDIVDIDNDMYFAYQLKFN